MFKKTTHSKPSIHVLFALCCSFSLIGSSPVIAASRRLSSLGRRTLNVKRTQMSMSQHSIAFSNACCLSNVGSIINNTMQQRHLQKRSCAAISDNFSSSKRTQKSYSALFKVLGATFIATSGIDSSYDREVDQPSQLPDDLPTTYEGWQEWYQHRMEQAQEKRNALLAVKGDRTLANTLEVYNDMEMYITTLKDTTRLLTYVHPDKKVRSWAEKMHEEAENFEQKIFLDQEIYKAIEAVHDNTLNNLDLRWYTETLRAFRLGGVDKDETTRKQIATVKGDIVQLSQTFRRNISEDIRTIEIHDVTDLVGLPDDFIENHKPDDKGIIRITTQYPDYFPVIYYAKNADLRKKLYVAFNDRGYPKNKDILLNLLKKRYELATLLGYTSYADYGTSTYMVGGRKQAKAFINKVRDIAHTSSQQEYDTLLAYRQQHEPEATDIAVYEYSFWLKRYTADHFGVKPEAVRPFFPFAQVKAGLFSLMGQMFQLRFEKVKSPTVWHPSVETYDVYDRRDGSYIGRIHLDLHPRKDKYQHACHRPMLRGVINKQFSESALVCNFPAPTEKDPAFMELKQVVTFFHEFGHLIHELLSAKQQWVRFSGSEAPQWDFIEAPSRMLEQWVVQPEVLQQFARHYKTQELISADMIANLVKARDFGSALSTAIQTCYATVSFDFYDQDPNQDFDLDKEEERIWQAYHPLAYVQGVHFYARFEHLLRYHAAYYTYLWSEVVANDLFTLFKRDGILNHDVCERYRKAILEPGASQTGHEMVETFLDRPLSFEAFKQHISGDKPV